jgi:hypothetical protein
MVATVYAIAAQRAWSPRRVWADSGRLSVSPGWSGKTVKPVAFARRQLGWMRCVEEDSAQ